MATKIGIFTDVHGNAPALRAVLAELAREDDVDCVYGAGDLIGIGPDTNEVLDLLFSLPDFTSVAGNHEDCILALMAGNPPGSPPGLADHHQWIAGELDRRFLPQLNAMRREFCRRGMETQNSSLPITIWMRSANCCQLIPNPVWIRWRRTIAPILPLLYSPVTITTVITSTRRSASI